MPQSYGLGQDPPSPLRKNSITNPLFLFDGFPKGKNKKRLVSEIAVPMKHIFSDFLLANILHFGANKRVLKKSCPTFHPMKMTTPVPDICLYCRNTNICGHLV